MNAKKFSRFISLCCQRFKNYYDILGVVPKATQTDIKTAYYKLSMIYHPDKNQGCKIATAKFQQIKEAYDVLSNYESRRLYDRGITLNKKEGIDREEIFKQQSSNVVQKQRPVSTASSPIYNYDEWSKAHYGESFDRRNNAKSEYEARKKYKEEEENMTKKNVVIFTVMLFIGLIILVSSTYEDLDKPQKKKN